MRQPATLRFELKPSLALRTFTVLVHLSALALLAALSLSLIVKLLIAAGIVFSAIEAYGKAALVSRRSIVGLQSKPDGSWRLLHKSGDERIAELRDYRLFARLIALCFKSGGYRRACTVVLYDSLSPQDFHRLRLRLLDSARSP